MAHRSPNTPFLREKQTNQLQPLLLPYSPPGETRHKPWPSKSTWSEYKQHSITFSRPAFGSVTETVNKSVNFKGWASVHRNWAEVTDLSSPVLLTAVFVSTLSHCEPQLEPPQAGSAVSPSSPWLAHSSPKTTSHWPYFTIVLSRM